MITAAGAPGDIHGVKSIGTAASFHEAISGASWKRVGCGHDPSYSADRRKSRGCRCKPQVQLPAGRKLIARCSTRPLPSPRASGPPRRRARPGCRDPSVNTLERVVPRSALILPQTGMIGRQSGSACFSASPKVAICGKLGVDLRVGHALRTATGCHPPWPQACRLFSMSAIA